MRARLAGSLLLLALGAAIVMSVAREAGGEERLDPLGERAPAALRDIPAAALQARAAVAFSHPLFAKSPGGVVASAARTARWRGQVEEAAEASGSDPDLIEAMVLLESAGRPDARAGRDIDAAAGLAQILAGTARDLLGMRVDSRASERLTRRIRRAERRGEQAPAERLRAERRRVDERFDPEKALRGMGRYLKIARERFGRTDLAVVSYHMGIGNPERALEAFGAGAQVSYARLYFESGLDRHPEAWRVLASLGDDSSTYLWRVLAAGTIMESWREDPAALERLASLQTAKASAEEVLHPPARTPVYDTPDELDRAYGDGALVRFPAEPERKGLRLDPRMGRLARRLGRSPETYRGLRPPALALAAWMGEEVRRLSGTDAALTVTSTVRDRRYQRLLARRNPEATHAYSLHTTGWAFDVLRRYRGREQAVAFQFVLDRLHALNLIAWVREPAAIHFTVSGEARAFELP